MSYSKAKGTAYESSVVKYLIECGFSDARRVALAGSNDAGDIQLGEVNNPYFVLECKNYAKEICYKQIEDFVQEAQTEFKNAKKEVDLNKINYRSLLLVKRINLGIADSWLIWKNSYNITLRCRLGDIINKSFLIYENNEQRFLALENILMNK